MLFYAILPFSISFAPPVNSLIRNVWFLVVTNYDKLSAEFLSGTLKCEKVEILAILKQISCSSN